MNPVVLEFGSFELHAYTVWVLGSILGGLALIAWRAYCYDPAAMLRWLDVGIAGVVAGVIGARALHVALEWNYFSDHTDEIDKFFLGGMAWHGGLLAAIPVVIGMARLRRVPLRPWLDALALAFPAALIGVWMGCRRAGCGYGYEVQTLADWPGWMVEELPDVYGFIAPRLDVQIFGVGLSVALGIMVLILTWGQWLVGLRLWIVLALAGLGFALLGFLRADPAHWLIDHRADQVFDLILFGASTLIGGALWLWDRRQIKRMESRLREL
ncbi:MAG: prolipoprotein diacylglyceryl transferase [Chloroflexi bacterium]|nr:prolipoprotein diacylglyceryl transferase [Chloroflexota bacterium]